MAAPRRLQWTDVSEYPACGKSPHVLRNRERSLSGVNYVQSVEIEIIQGNAHTLNQPWRDRPLELEADAATPPDN